MKKVIKKIGGSIGIYFDKEEQLVYDLEVGDIIDLEFRKVENEEKS